MRQRVRKKIEQFHMLSRGDKVLIGLSGGADSVCLAQILFELKEEYNLILGAVYCHHGIRGAEADEDKGFVQDFCKERGIVFYFFKESVEERAHRKKMTIEEAGREFRYEIFQRIMEEENYNKLAVAHHADDRAETMLFHLARGTAITGLSTMEPVRSFAEDRWLIRPLLWDRKTVIEQWLKRKGISWRVDGTNLTDLYARNKIRHHILPAMEEINERAVEHMGETAEHLSEVCSFLKEEEEKIYDRCVSLQENSMVIDIGLLKQTHSYLAKGVLYRCLAAISGGRKDIASVHVQILKDLMDGETGKTVSLPRGICARKEYERLYLSRDDGMQNELEGRYKIDVPELLMERSFYTGQEILKNEYTKQFDYDKIKNKLCLRFWQEGDYLFLKENGGKKKVSRYFIDEKIPADKRSKIPLLADGNHILWIVGHRISAYYKVTEQTKEILTVTIKNKG